MTTPNGLNRTLEQVRKLVALAEHPDTPEHEAQLARQRADALMLKYAIDEAMLDQTRPVTTRIKPMIIEVATYPRSSSSMDEEAAGYITSLARSVAHHCRCRIQSFYRFDRETGLNMARVFGFEGDIRYFEALYTTLRLHMMGILLPQIDSSLSLEENCYRLHTAGFNWLEIAAKYGWRKVGLYTLSSEELAQLGNAREAWRHSSGEVRSNTKLGSHYKRAYYRAVERRGEQPLKVAAGGSATYRTSAAAGYTARIAQRLRDVERQRNMAANESGALEMRVDILEDFIREMNPKAYTKCPACQKLSADPYTCDRCNAFLAEKPAAEPPCQRCLHAKSGRCREHTYRSYKPPPFSETAYRAGSAHANTANLGANLGGSKAGELE